MIKAVTSFTIIGTMALTVAQPAFAQSASSKHVQATVTATKRTVNERQWAATLQLAVAPGWHIYAEESGTAGIATTIEWKLARGWHALTSEWPKPHRQVTGRDTTYEYTGTISVPLKLQADAGAPAATHTMTVAYGVCKNICIPEHVTLNVKTAWR